MMDRGMILRVLLERGTERFADRVFLKYKAQGRVENETFKTFFDSVCRWSSFLIEHGVREGDRVAVVSDKSSVQVRLMYAVWMLGAVAVPVCEVLGHDEMRFVIDDCDPKLIIVQDKHTDKYRQAFGERVCFNFYEIMAYAEQLETCPRVPPLKQCGIDDVAALIYTSGSTGMPKGVMLSHRNLSVNAQSAVNGIGLTGNDLCFSILPYWHSFALTVEVIMPMLAGFTVGYANDRRDFLKSMTIYNPTVILGVPRVFETVRSGILKEVSKQPPMVQKLFKYALRNSVKVQGAYSKGGCAGWARRKLHKGSDYFFFRKIRKRFGSQLRFFVGGGAPLDVDYQHFFKGLGIPIFQGYGLTEASPVISANCSGAHKLGSSGRIFDWLHGDAGGDYTFLTDDGVRGKGLEGELLVKGDCVMKGYWRHADESAKTLDDGWLHTGDVAYVDEEGFLFISGRKGNMIVLLGGEKLHPEHVEDALKHSDYISEVMVIGEGLKNVYACVNVPEEKRNAHSEEELTAVLKKEIQKHCAHLAVFQRPKAAVCLPDFNIEDGTLTATLKVRRYKVKERDRLLIDSFLSSCGESI